MWTRRFLVEILLYRAEIFLIETDEMLEVEITEGYLDVLSAYRLFHKIEETEMERILFACVKETGKIQREKEFAEHFRVIKELEKIFNQKCRIDHQRRIWANAESRCLCKESPVVIDQ